MRVRTQVRGGTRVRAGMALAIAVSVLAAGCSSGSGGTPAQPSAPSALPTENVSLNFWWWGGDDAKGLGAFVKKAVADYKVVHPNITIVPLEQSTDGILAGYKAAAAAKEGPDISYSWGGIWSLENVWKGSQVPISDYIPAEELKHYLNASENTYDGKVWTMPWQLAPSFPVLYRKDVFAKVGLTPPTTWDQMLTACDTFAAKGDGMSLFAGGIKDGWFGGWLWSIIGQQQMGSVSELMNAATGANGASMTDPAIADYWTKLEQMHARKCWNDDLGSIQLYQGQQRFIDGKAGITVTGSVTDALIDGAGGSDNLIVGTMPAWGTGPYANRIGSSSQTLGITSWSKYPQVAADFLMFLHTPEQLKSMYDLSKTFPADDRVDVSWFKRPVDTEVFNLGKSGGPYLENFIPTQLDSDGIIKHSQLVLTGNETAAAAAAAVQVVADGLKKTQRAQLDSFTKWAESF